MVRRLLVSARVLHAIARSQLANDARHISPRMKRLARLAIATVHCRVLSLCLLCPMAGFVNAHPKGLRREKANQKRDQETDTSHRWTYKISWDSTNDQTPLCRS